MVQPFYSSENKSEPALGSNVSGRSLYVYGSIPARSHSQIYSANVPQANHKMRALFCASSCNSLSSQAPYPRKQTRIASGDKLSIRAATRLSLSQDATASSFAPAPMPQSSIHSRGKSSIKISRLMFKRPIRRCAPCALGDRRAPSFHRRAAFRREWFANAPALPRLRNAGTLR